MIPWGLRVPIWKINFCSSVLRLSELPRCKERPQTAICSLEWLGRSKCLATGLDASCHFFLRREGVLGIGHLVVFLFHQSITPGKTRLTVCLWLDNSLTQTKRWMEGNYTITCGIEKIPFGARNCLRINSESKKTENENSNTHWEEIWRKRAKWPRAITCLFLYPVSTENTRTYLFQLQLSNFLLFYTWVSFKFVQKYESNALYTFDLNAQWIAHNLV